MKFSNKIKRKLGKTYYLDNGTKISKHVKLDGNIIIGNNCIIRDHVTLSKDVVIGDNTLIGQYSHIHGPVTIGSGCVFAPYIAIYAADHDLVGNLRDRGRFKRIKICDNVWIGYGAIILKGVLIDYGAVIGAGSVVTHDVYAEHIVAGNPAKFIRMKGERKDE